MSQIMDQFDTIFMSQIMDQFDTINITQITDQLPDAYMKKTSENKIMNYKIFLFC